MIIIDFRILITVILVCTATVLPAQDFDKYKKQQQEAFAKLKQQQEDELNQLRKTYNAYVKKRNDEFAKFVENSWKTFNALKGDERPRFPKPDSIPVHEKRETQNIPLKIPSSLEEDDANQKLLQENEPIQLPKTDKPEPDNLILVDFTFYNQPIGVAADPDLASLDWNELSKEKIADVLRIISDNDYGYLLDQLYAYKELFNLNDWGFLQLTDSLSQKLTNKNKNFSRIVTWGLMNYAGYKVKIGLNKERCYLMIASLQKLYGVYKLDSSAEKYYILDFNGDQIGTYEYEFEGAVRNFDFKITRPLNLENAIVSNSNENDSAKIPAQHVIVNKNVIDFYKTYPRVDFSIYFNAPMSAVTRNSLFEQLIPQMEGKPELEKVEFLLNYVQTNFKYQTDREQFNQEKFFFPEELFYYPYSDCEDRSALFIYLVKTLIKKEVVALHYFDHMATAVALFDEPKGEYIEYNNRYFTVCDPTFTNAPVGIGMPAYRKYTPEIIPVQGDFSKEEIIAQHWEKLISGGAVKSSRQNSVSDARGNCFLAGTFKNKLSIQDKTIHTGSNEVNAFVVCFSPNDEVLWLKNIDYGTFNFCNGIMHRNDQVFVSINSIGYKGNNSNITCNAYGNDGNLAWTNSAAVDSSFLSEDMVKSYSFGFDGTMLSDKNIFPGNQIFNSGLFFSNNRIVANIDFRSSPGLKKEDIAVSSYSELGVFDLLKKRYNEYLENSCERYTAAVLAVFKVLKQNGMQLKGSDLCSMLENNNPEIAEKNSDLVENLRKVKYFVNENGRIILRTLDGKKIQFFKMYFSDNASVVIRDVNQQKTKIECLSGVQVGNTLIKFPLNYISVDMPNGNFLFDYGSDNSKSNVNLREDILKI